MLNNHSCILRFEYANRCELMLSIVTSVFSFISCQYSRIQVNFWCWTFVFWLQNVRLYSDNVYSFFVVFIILLFFILHFNHFESISCMQIFNLPRLFYAYCILRRKNGSIAFYEFGYINFAWNAFSSALHSEQKNYLFK